MTTRAIVKESEACDAAEGRDVGGGAEGGGASFDINRSTYFEMGTELIVAVKSTELGEDAFGNKPGTKVRISLYSL